MNTETKAPRFKACGDGVYKELKTGKFYHRPKINGKSTWRVLDVHLQTKAKELKRTQDSNQTLHKFGLAKDPYGAPAAKVGELIKAYVDAGYPTKKHRKRDGKQLKQEVSRIAFLTSFWEHRQAESIKPSDCSGYYAHRKSAIRSGFSGGRAIDMELGTLAGIFRWAVGIGKLDRNPLLERDKFRGRDGSEVRHCRECQPKDAAELHNLARALFEDRMSEPLGWQLLLEGMTGCRTVEVLRLRWDAAPGQAGHVDGDILHLARAKKGINPAMQIHEGLAQTLEALRCWRSWRGLNDSPWFVPSMFDKRKPVDGTSLSKALHRIAERICGQGQERTSHGLRAYYVAVRRSMGISDAQIAAEIGDKTGAGIIASTYGAPPENWLRKQAAPMSFMVDSPAWLALDMPGNLLDLGKLVAG